jgi:hypothetical protein
MAAMFLRDRLGPGGHGAALKHESGYQSMESRAVVEPQFGEPQEPANVLRRRVGKEFQSDGPPVGTDDGPILRHLLRRRFLEGRPLRRGAFSLESPQDLDALQDTLVCVGLQLRNRLRYAHPLDYPAEHGVVAVQLRLVRHADEELSAGAIGFPRYQNRRNRASGMRKFSDFRRQFHQSPGPVQLEVVGVAA